MSSRAWGAQVAARRRAWNEKKAKKPAVPSDETTERPRYASIRSLIEQGAEKLGTRLRRVRVMKYETLRGQTKSDVNRMSEISD